MTKEQAQKTYGKHGPASYSVIVPDFHRMRLVIMLRGDTIITAIRWDQGDWTDDTDQVHQYCNAWSWGRVQYQLS